MPQSVHKWGLYVHYPNKAEERPVYREVSIILVARTGSHTCPVALTKRILLVGQHKDIVQADLTVVELPRATELVKKQGLDPSQYGLHSLRSGGPSSAFRTYF